MGCWNGRGWGSRAPGKELHCPFLLSGIHPPSPTYPTFLATPPPHTLHTCTACLTRVSIAWWLLKVTGQLLPFVPLLVPLFVLPPWPFLRAASVTVCSMSTLHANDSGMAMRLLRGHGGRGGGRAFITPGHCSGMGGREGAERS